MNIERIHKVEALLQAEGPVLRASVLRSARFCSKDIASLIQSGHLQKIRWGYYVSPSVSAMDENALIASLIPEGVFSLFSAAQYHDLSTVIPSSIEITLPVGRRIPVLPDDVHVTIYKSVPTIYQLGIDTVQDQEYTLKIYDRERTVCDFFRMRLKIGKDAALEVLKNYMSGKKNLQKLYEYAERLQIKGVMHPYLEAQS
jgi:predicted transcriptional regulator of viral defense system